jgi:hypothetical protein
MTEYKGDFPTDGSQICFLLSFFKEGLPEKFAVNYIDKIINQTTNPKDWGTIVNFATLCQNTFSDKNRKSNAENQIAPLKQGGKLAEEFFQEFDQITRITGYDDTHHDDDLIKLIRDAVHAHIIDSIYRQDPLPADYAAWKTKITTIDNVAQQRFAQKKAKAPVIIPFIAKTTPKQNVPQTRTGTGTKGQCFRCGQQGHIS